MFCRNEALDVGSSGQFQITVVKKKGLVHYDLVGGAFVPSKDLKDLDDAIHKVPMHASVVSMDVTCCRTWRRSAEMETTYAWRRSPSITWSMHARGR